MPPSIAVSSIFMSSISNRGKSISIHPANCGPHDNHTRGTVAELPAELIKDEASHALVSAYFTIQANEAMRRQLDGMRHMRFLFGEPWFIRNRDPDKTDKKAFDIGDAGLQLKNRLENAVSPPIVQHGVRSMSKSGSCATRFLTRQTLPHR